VPRGKKCTVVFAIHNRRSVPIRIASARSSCGCVVATPPQSVLQPGERSQLSVTFETAGYEGEKKNDVQVLLDQPIMEYITLKVKAVIHPEVQVSFGEIDLGRVRQGGDAANALQVQFAGQHAYRILRVETNSTHVSATFEETYRQAGRAGYTIKTRLSKTAPAGQLREQIQVVLDHPTMPTFTLDVKAHVTHSLQAEPDSVFFGFVAPNVALERTVRVRGDRPFRVTRFSSSSGRVKVRAPGAAAQEHTITIVLHTGASVGNVRDDVKLYTDTPGQPPLALTVYANVRAQ